MKSFKQYLTEKQQMSKTSDMLFNARIAHLIHANKPEFPVFLSPTMFNRLKMTKKDLITFHSTDLNGLDNIIKMQNSSKSVSTSVIFDYYRLIGGIETDGGVLVILQGDVLLRSDFDAFTHVTEEGRRLVWMGENSQFIQNLTNDEDLLVIISRNASEFQRQLYRLYETIMKKYRVQFAQFVYDFIDSGVKEYFSSKAPNDGSPRLFDDKMFQKLVDGIQSSTSPLGDKIQYVMSMSKIVRKMQKMKFPSNLKGAADNMIKKFNKAKSGFIADYIDGTEKILKDNDMFRQLFFMSGFPSDGARVEYDELVITNFEVRYVYIDYGSPNLHIEDIKAKFIKNSTNRGRDKKFIDFVASKLIDNETLKRYIKEAKGVLVDSLTSN